jgi:hypothetical protein
MGTVFADVPRGVFCVSAAGVKCKDSVLANPSVDGIGLRQDWKDLEPAEGVYNFSFLDSEVARAHAAGKPVLLRINTQAGKPAWVTAAVAEAGGSFFTFDDSGVQATIPVFWDPTFLGKKIAMIRALGARYASNPTVKIVWTSFANASSEDWSVPHTPPEVTAWLAVGYTSEKMLDAGRQIIDATMTAFPSQYVTLAVSGNGRPTGSSPHLDPDESYVARNAVLGARTRWPNRLIVQKNSLAAFTPPAPGVGTVFQLLWDSRPDVGGQMLDASYGDTTFRNNAGVPDDPAHILHKSVDQGVGYGMKYIEIYQTDISNLSSEITYAHSALLSSTGVQSPPTTPPQTPTGLQVKP